MTMKTFSRITLLSISIILMAVTGLMAQREISGTVYMDGKPAAGVTVEVNRGGGTAFTGFDGKYKVEASTKSKWIKFSSADGHEQQVDLDENSGDVVNCALTGEIPSGDEEGGTEVITKSQEELLKDANKEYMNEVSLYGTDLTTGDTPRLFRIGEMVYNEISGFVQKYLYSRCQNI